MVILYCALPALGDALGADECVGELGDADELGTGELVVDEPVVDVVLEQPAMPTTTVAAAATTSELCFAASPFRLDDRLTHPRMRRRRG